MSGLSIKRSNLLVFLVALFLSFLMVIPVIAGEGNGSGGGQDEPLALLSSSPQDGQTGVALDTTEIKLSFNKNVVNMTVKENNLQCFAFYAGEKAVPFKVEMADDQIYAEYKRDIVLVPEQELQPATTYTVVISPELQGKSGAVMVEETKISFTTTGSSAEQDTGEPTDADKGNEVKAPDSSDKSSGDVEAANATEPSEVTAPDSGEKDTGINTTALIIIILAAAALLYVFIKRKK